MRNAGLILTLMVVFSTVSAECYTNARGRYACGNGREAGEYNTQTGKAWKSEKN
jgi:hypothetical protein